MQLDDAPWTSDESSASGQVFEFLLWAAITSQSRGWLHVYLPLTDRGIDGLIDALSANAGGPSAVRLAIPRNEPI